MKAGHIIRRSEPHSGGFRRGAIFRLPRSFYQRRIDVGGGVGYQGVLPYLIAYSAFKGDFYAHTCPQSGSSRD